MLAGGDFEELWFAAQGREQLGPRIVPLMRTVHKDVREESRRGLKRGVHGCPRGVYLRLHAPQQRPGGIVLRAGLDRVKVKPCASHAGRAPGRIGQVLRVGEGPLIALEELRYRARAIAFTLRPAVGTHETRVETSRIAVGISGANELACCRVDVVERSVRE